MLLVGEDTGRLHGCYGHEIARTPAIDNLAKEGVLYKNAFSTAPVCAPSRSTLVTGKYAFSIGSHHMRSTLLNPPRLFTHELQDAGYHVNWANKTDFNFEPPADFANETKEWAEALASREYSDKPWFLYHNFGITHESTMWRDHWENVVAPKLTEEERCSPEDVQFQLTCRMILVCVKILPGTSIVWPCRISKWPKFSKRWMTVERETIPSLSICRITDEGSLVRRDGVMKLVSIYL